MNKINTKQFLKYCYIGIIGGILEIGAFYLFNDVLNIHYVFANIISFTISIIFLFYYNSNFVFNIELPTKKAILKKFNFFLASRIIGLVFDTGVLALCISIIGLPSIVSKIISCSSSAIINYFVGKLLIFK